MLCYAVPAAVHVQSSTECVACTVRGWVGGGTSWLVVCWAGAGVIYVKQDRLFVCTIHRQQQPGLAPGVFGMRWWQPGWYTQPIVAHGSND